VIRLVFTIIAGVLLGGVVHLVSVLALPRIATQDAYSRLTPITKLNAVTVLPAADPSNTLKPYLDPAFATAKAGSMNGIGALLGSASGSGVTAFSLVIGVSRE